jgi:hypothetical protein
LEECADILKMEAEISSETLLPLYHTKIMLNNCLGTSDLDKSLEQDWSSGSGVDPATPRPQTVSRLRATQEEIYSKELMQTAVHKLESPEHVRRRKLEAGENYTTRSFIILPNIVRMIISKRMGWACSSNEREEKDTQNFGRTT